jgi:hypothetical protein
MDSSMASGTPASRPSQANSRAAAAPATTMAHHLIVLRECESLMRRVCAAAP